MAVSLSDITIAPDRILVSIGSMPADFYSSGLGETLRYGTVVATYPDCPYDVGRQVFYYDIPSRNFKINDVAYCLLKEKEIGFSLPVLP